MRSVFNHPVYGEIVYDENFWTGKKTLFVNGAPMTMMDKKTFYFTWENEKTTVNLKGNYITGLKMIINGKEFQVVPSPKWYEIVCSVFLFVLVLAWGTSPQLCSIFPIVGGAIGGAICGVMAMVNLLVMKAVKKLWLKLLIWLAFIVVTFLLCFIVAVVFLSVV